MMRAPIGTTLRSVASCQMLSRPLSLIALPVLAISVAACDRQKTGTDPEVQPAETVAAVESIAATPLPPAPNAASPARLDAAALDERKDPDRLLRFYAAALKARDWKQAARAWGQGSGVTAITLEGAYDRADPPLLEVGKGVIEGAAGSLYYEAPVVLHFGAESEPERGTLTLRRVNDVPGASAEQLSWRIERVTIGVGQ